MYELYSADSGFKLLNLSTVSYNVNVQTRRYNHGGSSWVEPVGRRFSNLHLEGPCDPLGGSFFSRLSDMDIPQGFLSSFIISEYDMDYLIGVSGACIVGWRYTDSENNDQSNFSLTFSVENIQRLASVSSTLKNEKKSTKKKVKEKKIVLPERQIVICRTI
jgi:hypothetical protein